MKLLALLVITLTTLLSFTLGDLLGSTCDPIHNTTACDSSTVLLTCNQSTWVFQSNCTLGTQCSSGMCIDQAQASDETLSPTTTVFSAIACPIVRAYGDTSNYDGCVPYSEYWASFVKDAESRSEGFFTFTVGTDEPTTSGAQGTRALGALGVSLALFAAGLGY